MGKWSEIEPKLFCHSFIHTNYRSFYGKSFAQKYTTLKAVNWMKVISCFDLRGLTQNFWTSIYTLLNSYKNNTIRSAIEARLWCGFKSSFQIKCNCFYLSCDFHAFMHSFKSRNIQDDLMGLFLVYAIACREVVIKPIKSTKCILIMHLHKLDIWTQIKCTG